MIQKVLSDGKVPVKVWTQDIEVEAIDQLMKLANLPFLFKHVAVMPDVHAGKGSTVGTVIATKDVVIPAAVGVDIGCGMAALLTPYTADQVQPKLDTIRNYIERTVPVGFSSHKTPHNLVATTEREDMWTDFEDYISPELKGQINKAQAQLGTLGGGNHFIEISVDELDRVWIVLHSGSRNIGKQVADIHIKKAKELMEKYYIKLPHNDLAFLSVSDEHGQQYLHDMKWAQRYAHENRALMLHLVRHQLAYAVEKKEFFHSDVEINCHHNYMDLEHHFGQNVYVTRKGAIRARKDDWGIIPGSMGARSFIVIGLGERESFTSASHGAGRKMSRSKAKKHFTVEDLEKQTAGVLCRKDGSVLDEIPGAYKDIDKVMKDEEDLVQPMHTLKQLISIKG